MKRGNTTARVNKLDGGKKRAKKQWHKAIRKENTTALTAEKTEKPNEFMGNENQKEQDQKDLDY